MSFIPVFTSKTTISNLNLMRILSSSPSYTHTHTRARIINTSNVFKAGCVSVYVTYFFSPFLIDARVTVGLQRFGPFPPTLFLLISDRVVFSAVNLPEPLGKRTACWLSESGGNWIAPPLDHRLQWRKTRESSRDLNGN